MNQESSMLFIHQLKRGRIKKRERQLLVSFLIFASLLSLSLFTLSYGNTNYSPYTVWKVLTGSDLSQTPYSGAFFAIGTLRLPRLLAGIFCGFAFGMAGCCFQQLLQNPLASPDIIGVSTGSSAAAVFAILSLSWSGTRVSLLAVFFGLLITFFIYLLSSQGHFSGGRLILIGIGIQAMLNALISYLLLSASQYDIPVAMRWLSGSLNGLQHKDLGLLIPVVCVFGSILLSCRKSLSMMDLGEAGAISLGISTKSLRLLLMICGVLLIAFATSVSGPIAFLSFLPGPIAKKLMGPGSCPLFTSGLVGSVLVLAADLVGQYAFSYRFPVGVITGILGAPFLIVLLIRIQKKGGAV